MDIEKDTTTSNATIKSWVELYSDHLFTWAYFKTSDKEAAEDIVQETFLAAVLSFEKYEGKSEPKTWLLSILNNKVADHFRTVYRGKETPAISFSEFFDSNEHWVVDQKPKAWEYDDEKHLLDNHDFKRTLSECINKLPDNWRASILLKFVEERDSHIICQELEISTTNYWQILHRAKLQLRKCLEQSWFNK